MAQIVGVEDLMRALFQQTTRKKATSNSSLTASTSVIDELPVKISLSNMDALSTIKWGDWIATNEIFDYFKNDTGSAANLNTHTSDSGHTWTAKAGTMNIDPADYILAITDAVYTVTLATGEQRISTIGLSSGNFGVVFRYLDGNNFWQFDCVNGTYRIVRVVGGGFQIISLGISSNILDSMHVDAIGSAVSLYINNACVYAVVDSSNASNTLCGVWAQGGSGWIVNFHAWDITASVLQLYSDPGHTVYDAEGIWLGQWQGGVPGYLLGHSTLIATGRTVGYGHSSLAGEGNTSGSVGTVLDGMVLRGKAQLIGEGAIKGTAA